MTLEQIKAACDISTDSGCWISLEHTSNTPDFILASYLSACLNAFNQAVQHREAWYGRDARPALNEEPPAPAKDVRLDLLRVCDRLLRRAEALEVPGQDEIEEARQAISAAMKAGKP